MQTNVKPAPRVVDFDIALDTHVKPKTMSDKIAYAFVRFCGSLPISSLPSVMVTAPSS